MKHAELLYQRLQEGKIRELIPEPELRYRINKIRTKLPIFYKTKEGETLKITKALLMGNIAQFKGVYISKPTELTFHAEYQNLGRTTKATVYQQIGNVRNKVSFLFGANATYKLEQKYKFQKPEKLPLVADIRRRRWVSDAHFEKMLTMGLADDRPRSADTYPEPNASNEILDLRTDWTEGADLYPKPVAEGIVISPRPPELVSGVFKWDIYYRVPLESAKVRLSYTVTNNTDRKLTIEEWSSMVSILYEDLQHMSFAYLKGGYSPKTLGIGQSTTYTFEVPLPEWVYGYVTVTHACKYYKNGMFAYGGGPIWNFRLGRVVLP